MKTTEARQPGYVNILGTPYEIVIDAPEDIMPEGADGATDQSMKRIVVAKLEVSRDTLQNMDEYRKKILRHEIIHAFMFESGLDSNWTRPDMQGHDETTVDWFAIQSPKIFEAFKEAGCL